MNPDGSNVTPLTTNSVPDVLPSWSPDGTKIAFQRCLDSNCNNRQVYVMNGDGNEQTLLASGSDPTWSPDGEEIAFTRSDACDDTGCPESDIWKINADGTGLSQVTNGNGISEGSVAWSPDGKSLALWCNQRICTMQSDGTGVMQLTTTQSFEPDWAPDGRRIVFAKPSGIVVMDSDGSNQLTIRASGRTPAWSPDGQKIVFADIVGGVYVLLVMDPDGSNVSQVSTAPGYAPAWQPLRALDPFPRPGGATPLRVPLVPVYAQCTDPNSEHVAPLSSPSCTPPAPLSSLLTTSTTGKGQGYARFDVEPGDPLTDADEADLAIQAGVTDVRNTSDGSDYAGKLILNATLRITDQASGFGGVSATTRDFGFSMPLDCLATPDPAIGGACNLRTSLDTLLAGTAKEGKRAVIASRLIQMLDVGADGQIASSGCPPTCGTGDEQPFVRQGVFAP